MNQSEPTTGEIVRALRCSADFDDSFCKKCQYGYALANAFLCDHLRMNGNAADRLESQEAQINQLTEALAYANEWHKESVENATNELRELSGITGELERFRAFHERYAEQTSKKYVEDICALTARAEQAERERDAAIKDITRLCTRCKHWTCPNDDEPCLSCLNAESGNPNWTWRGLPQEGEKE